MKNLLISRSRLATLLLPAIVPCLAASQAAGGVLSSFNPAQVPRSALVQSQAVSPEPLSDAPGTPYPFNNSGSETIIIGYEASSATPAPVSGSNTFGISTTVAGDVVMLSNPAGSDDPSNWAAVFRFFNPNDPTGTQGLPADAVEGFDSDDVSPGSFAGFQLLPNTVYLADTTTSSGSHIATADELGPDQGIEAGQTTIFVYTVDATGSGVVNPVGGPGGGNGSVPEPGTWTLVAGATLLLFVAVCRRLRGGGIRVPLARDSGPQAS